MSSDKMKNKYYVRILLYCFCAFLFIGIAVYYSILQDLRVKKTRELIELNKELNAIKADFQKILNVDITAAKAMAVYCSEYPDLEKFDLFAKAVLEENAFSEAIQLNVNGIIKKAYPLKGSEKVIGFNTLIDTIRRYEYYRSIKNMSIYFAGPRKLRQGGIGILGKLPFKMKDGTTGATVVITKLQTIKRLLRTHNKHKNKFSYWLVKNSKYTDNLKYFLSNTQPSKSSPVFYAPIPEGEWNLYIAFSHGYAKPTASWWILGSGLFLLFVICIYIYKRTLAPYHLDLIIHQKSKEILHQEKYYRTLVEQSSDAIALLDEKGAVKFQTKSAEKILGYSLEEIQRIDGASILHPDYREKYKKEFRSLINKNTKTYDTQIRILKKSGSYIWIECTYLDLLDDPFVSSIVLTYRDITTRVELMESEAKIRYLLSERIKELSVVYKVTSMLQNSEIDEKTLLNQIVNLIPDGFQFPDICHSRIEYNNELYKTPNYSETDCFLKASSNLNNGSVIVITVNYPVSESDLKELVFLREEENMLKSIVENLKIYFEKKFQQQKLIESEMKFKSAFENSPVGMAMVTLDGKFFLANKTLCNMLGYTEIELQSLDMKSITYPDDFAADFDFITNAKKGLVNIYKTENRYLHKNGNIVFGNLNVSVINDANGQPNYFASQIEDITTRKILEVELKNSLIERTSVIEDLRKRVNELQQYSYIVSHNLRAPVANLKGLTQLLELDKHDQEAVTFLSNNIKSSVDNLDHIISDLNDILNIQKDKTETKSEIYFSEKVEKVKMMLQNVILEKNAIIETDFAEINSYYTIKSYLLSVFFNLLSNALKFTKPDVQPLIKIWSVKKDNEIEIHFKDNGIGIDLNKNKDIIFGLYKKLNKNYEGRGMGLFMLKSQIEAINGQIEVNSQLNEGTHFIVKLPVVD